MKEHLSREEIIQGLDGIHVLVVSDVEMYVHSKNVDTFSDLLNGAAELLKKDAEDLGHMAQAVKQRKAALERIRSEIRGVAGNCRRILQ